MEEKRGVGARSKQIKAYDKQKEIEILQFEKFGLTEYYIKFLGKLNLQSIQDLYKTIDNENTRMEEKGDTTIGSRQEHSRQFAKQTLNDRITSIDEGRIEANKQAAIDRENSKEQMQYDIKIGEIKIEAEKERKALTNQQEVLSNQQQAFINQQQALSDQHDAGLKIRDQMDASRNAEMNNEVGRINNQLNILTDNQELTNEQQKTDLIEKTVEEGLKRQEVEVKRPPTMRDFLNGRMDKVQQYMDDFYKRRSIKFITNNAERILTASIVSLLVGVGLYNMHKEGKEDNKLEDLEDLEEFDLEPNDTNFFTLNTNTNKPSIPESLLTGDNQQTMSKQLLNVINNIPSDVLYDLYRVYNDLNSGISPVNTVTNLSPATKKTIYNTYQNILSYLPKNILDIHKTIVEPTVSTLLIKERNIGASTTYSVKGQIKSGRALRKGTISKNDSNLLSNYSKKSLDRDRDRRDSNLISNYSNKNIRQNSIVIR